MTACSPLSATLSKLLRSKSITAQNIIIVVDNAHRPSDGLVDQALESSKIFIDVPNKYQTDLLGSSCMCVLGDFDETIDFSDEDEEDSFMDQTDLLDGEIYAKSWQCSRWETAGHAADETSLVCPARSSTDTLKSSAMKEQPRNYGPSRHSSMPASLKNLQGLVNPKYTKGTVTDVLSDAISMSGIQDAGRPSTRRRSNLKHPPVPTNNSSIPTSPDFRKICRKANLVF
jgi:hypothetical protein